MKVVTIFLYFFLSISLTATPEQAAANFEQHGVIKWMHDYLADSFGDPDERGYSMYSLLYYSPETKAINP